MQFSVAPGPVFHPNNGYLLSTCNRARVHVGFQQKCAKELTQPEASNWIQAKAIERLSFWPLLWQGSKKTYQETCHANICEAD